MDARWVVDTFGATAVRWYQSLPEVDGHGWFLLEVTPAPGSAEERVLIASDIDHGRATRSWEGKLRHSPNCQHRRHDLPRTVQNALRHKIQPTQFRVAVREEGRDSNSASYPKAIAFEPEISRLAYPGHPHLNLTIPCTICYCTDGNDLGTTPEERMLAALHQISIWLFRHQIWEVTRKWIGPEAPGFPSYTLALFLNPAGPCRCGHNTRYIDCHLINDVRQVQRCSLDPQLSSLTLSDALIHLQRSWRRTIGVKHYEQMHRIKEAFLCRKADYPPGRDDQ